MMLGPKNLVSRTTLGPNAWRGMERGFLLGFFALMSTFAKLVFDSSDPSMRKVYNGETGTSGKIMTQMVTNNIASWLPERRPLVPILLFDSIPRWQVKYLQINNSGTIHVLCHKPSPQTQQTLNIISNTNMRVSTEEGDKERTYLRVYIQTLLSKMLPQKYNFVWAAFIWEDGNSDNVILEHFLIM